MRSPAGVGGCDNRSGADTGNAVNGDMVLVEDLEDTSVSDAAGEAASQRQPDANRRYVR